MYELATAVGGTSDVFASPFGYHILTVLEAGGEKAHVAHILTKFIIIDEQIVSMKDATNIKRFVAVEAAE